MKRPIVDKKPLRRMEQSIFRTIVEMAYEMERADNYAQTEEEIRRTLDDIIKKVRCQHRPANFFFESRSYSKESLPFNIKGRRYIHQVNIWYSYRDGGAELDALIRLGVYPVGSDKECSGVYITTRYHHPKDGVKFLKDSRDDMVGTILHTLAIY